MKSTSKSFLVAASVAVIAAGSALADNVQHSNLLANERARTDQERRVTTVAAYTGDRGVGYGHEAQQSSETKFEIRTNAHGDQFVVAVPVR